MHLCIDVYDSRAPPAAAKTCTTERWYNLTVAELGHVGPGGLRTTPARRRTEELNARNPRSEDDDVLVDNNQMGSPFHLLLF